MRQAVLLLLLGCLGMPSWASKDPTLNGMPLEWNLFQDQQGQELARSRILDYKAALRNETVSAEEAYREMAMAYAFLKEDTRATEMLTAYLNENFNPAVLKSPNFDSIRTSEVFVEIEETYAPRHSFWSYFYRYIALIGFYIGLVLFLNKKVDLKARGLMGTFVLIHSIFILHISLVITNLQFEFPHSYLMSTCFSFLYGPLIYFYFKRTTRKYIFRKADLLHLLPTLLLLVYLIPVYGMSSGDKLELMLLRISNEVNPADSSNLSLLVSLKLISLVVYGWLIRREFLNPRELKNSGQSLGKWQRNIYRIHLAYVFSYAIYGILIVNQINSGVIYHLQVICMALMVIYVGYFASIRPEIFGSVRALERAFFKKYNKSGLTESLSDELRDQLIRLMEKEEIYKKNDLSLEDVAKRLNTTRHNASQVINEHFNLGFHELVNQYRIQAAKNLLQQDVQKNMNIIDIAYEVGYNNKVTFNKAFKKHTQLTPSQFQKQSVFAHVNQA